MAKGINAFLIVSGRIIPMFRGEGGLYFYNNEGWALCFHEQEVYPQKRTEANVETEFLAEITFYESEFYDELNEFVQEYQPPIYLKRVTSCFEDKWGRMYVMM